MSEDTVSEQVRRRLERFFEERWIDMTPPALRFPNGLRWRFFSAPAKGRKEERDYCWSTTRNANGKFVSWWIAWDGNEGGRRGFREHCKRKDAKARALRMFERRTA